MQVLIVGASRGIGLEFVRQYRADGAEVSATARDDAGLQRLAALGARPIRLDVSDAASTSGLARQITGSVFDIVLYNAGVYGPRSRELDTPSEVDFNRVMQTNVLGAMRVLPQAMAALAPRARVAVISSRMGSLGARTAATGWLYRASKAGLNSVLKDVSFVLGGKAICVALHPGWVRTDMGGVGADLDVADSVATMRATLAALQPRASGSLLNLDGTPMPW